MLTVVRASIVREVLLLRYLKCLAVPLSFTSLTIVMQGRGGLLIRKYDGDFWNVVGFPAASFFKLIELLIEEEDDFLDI
jgi:predicted house-cleaning NTP pyrophosphatase (Maf/HAM1 superfamily)